MLHVHTLLSFTAAFILDDRLARQFHFDLVSCVAADSSSVHQFVRTRSDCECVCVCYTQSRGHQSRVAFRHLLLK